MKGLYGLVGMQHRTPEDRAHFARLPNGSPLILRREADNRFDPNAVQVWSGDVHIGYVKGSQVKPLALAMDQAIRMQALSRGGGGVLPAKLAIDGGKWPLIEVGE